MPTPSEQKALAFVAIVILLGGAVRVLRAGAISVPSVVEQQALARQATAADSAASRRKITTMKRGKPKRAARDTIPVSVGGVMSVPPTFARPDRPFDHAPYGTVSPEPIDLDMATEEQIESLPRIGPTFAKRIVANRDSLGPFKSLDGLKRVKGMGKATMGTLAPLVTFSGRRSVVRTRPD